MRVGFFGRKCRIGVFGVCRLWVKRRRKLKCFVKLEVCGIGFVGINLLFIGLRMIGIFLLILVMVCFDFLNG